jgi:coenzyme F420 hydrogenase subunit beta
MLKTVSDVVENQICTGCGTCAGICPLVAIKMTETLDGRLIPEIDFSICRHCGLCDSVCPQLQISPRMNEYLDNPYIGPIQTTYLCRAIDPMVAFEGQTGGLVRSLLAWALESGTIDGVVCVKDDPSDYSHPKAMLLMTPSEVLNCSRSKYCPVGVNQILSRLLEFNGNVAYVGLGCHMQGLALAMEKFPKLREKISLRIGLFCDRVLTFRAVDYLVRCAGVCSGEISQIDYRHKEWRGWYGDIRIVKNNKSIVNLSRTWRSSAREYFTPLACRLCVDKLNALADISVGDPHGINTGKEVSTVVITRTQWGEKILLDGQHAGRIHVEPLELNKILMSQNITCRVNQALSFQKEMQSHHLDSPAFLKAISSVASFQKRRVWIWLVVNWTLFSQQPAGIWVVKYFPHWIPFLIYHITRIKKRLMRIPQKGFRFLYHSFKK